MGGPGGPWPPQYFCLASKVQDKLLLTSPYPALESCFGAQITYNSGGKSPASKFFHRNSGGKKPRLETNIFGKKYDGGIKWNYYFLFMHFEQIVSIIVQKLASCLTKFPNFGGQLTLNWH